MSAEKSILEALEAGDFCTALELQLNQMIKFARLPGNTLEQTEMATSSAAAIKALIDKCATNNGATFQECCRLVMAGRQMGIAECLVGANAAQFARDADQEGKPH